jgi:kinetochore protein NNF1
VRAWGSLPCRELPVRRQFEMVYANDQGRPHLLPAPEVMAAHLAPHLAQQQSQLNAKLQNTQAHNRKLFDDIQKQREEMQSLLNLVGKMFKDIDATNDMLDGVVEDIAKETRTVEVEMAESS